jgi:hypothetical protein
MTKIKFFLLGASIVFLNIPSVDAQKVLQSGFVKLEITEVDAEDPQQAMMVESMKGTETLINFIGLKSCTSMSMMGGMINMKVNADQESNKFDMFMDAMGQKIWIESPLDASVSAEDKEKAEKAQVSYDKTSTKEIAGYKCYAFTIKNDEGGVINGFLTSEIAVPNNNIQGYQTLKLEGFPMEYSVKNNGISMTITAIQVSDKVDENAFKVDTQGYKKMTMEEFRSMMGGAGF